MSDSAEHRWAAFGRFIAAAGGLAAVLALLLTVYIWWFSGPRIVVEARWSEFAYPAEMASILDLLLDAQYGGLPPVEDDSLANESARRSGLAIRRHFPYEELSALQQLRYVWFLEVTNEGNEEADVELQIERLQYATISREGGLTEAISRLGSDDRIPAGVVRPGETLLVTAWSASTTPRRLGSDTGVILYQSSGRGRVQQLGLVGPRWYWLASEFPRLIWLFVALVLSGLQIWAIIRKDRSEPPT